MDYKFLYEHTKQLYEKALKDIEYLKEKSHIKKQVIPEFSFFDRRVEDRRKKEVPVETDRRSGKDRRQGLTYVKPEFERIFKDFYPKNKLVHPLIIKSNRRRIIDAYWELWHVILGYDLKKIKNIRDIYIPASARDEIINKVEGKGFYKKGIAVSRAGGGYLLLNSIFVKDPEDLDEYYVFIIVDQFQEDL